MYPPQKKNLKIWPDQTMSSQNDENTSRHQTPIADKVDILTTDVKNV